MKGRLVSTTTMIRISVDRLTFRTAISSAIRINAQTNIASILIINTNNYTTPIDIKQNFVNFTPKILKNANIKVSVRSPILKTKSSKISSWFICSKKRTISTFTSTKQYGAHLHKSTYFDMKVTNVISVYMRTTFRISGGIRKSTRMSLLSAKTGIFQMRLNQLRRLGASWVWSAKNVMVGWSKDIILPSFLSRRIFL